MDLFFIFIWYDVSLFPMYLLIAVWGSTRKEYAAMKLTLYLLAGSALILPAIVYLVVKSGFNTFDLVALMQPGTFTPFEQKLAFFLFYIGFGILAGVWPFHTWSPVGHVAAPTAVSMIHAGVLMKIGAFGVLRVGMFLCPEGWQYWAHFMALLATIGIVYGVFVGLRQTDLKYVIGYSSVSHMGIVGLGLATVTVEGLNGAVFQMFAHGVMTALFFSSVGYIYDRTHTKTIAELGGLSHIMPVACGYFIVAALTGIGVPCLASFWAELHGIHRCLQGLSGVRNTGGLRPGGQCAVHVAGGAANLLRAEKRTFCPSARRLFWVGYSPDDPGLGHRIFRSFSYCYVRHDSDGINSFYQRVAMMNWMIFSPEIYFLSWRASLFWACPWPGGQIPNGIYFTALILASVGVGVCLACVRLDGRSVFGHLPGGPVFPGIQGHAVHGAVSGGMLCTELRDRGATIIRNSICC